VRVFADGAGDHGVVESSHEGVEAVAKRATALSVDEHGKVSLLADDVRGVQRDLRMAEHLELESADSSVHLRDRVLRVDDAQAVMAGSSRKRIFIRQS
jgi:hypothetical protein